MCYDSGKMREADSISQITVSPGLIPSHLPQCPRAITSNSSGETCIRCTTRSLPPCERENNNASLAHSHRLRAWGETLASVDRHAATSPCAIAMDFVRFALISAFMLKRTNAEAEAWANQIEAA